MKIAFFLLFNIALLSASNASYFRNYSIDEGLPSSEVYQVIQDNENHIWFATDRGVSRFDGYQFETFGMKDGLTDDVVFGFHLDYDNRLWFITYTRGVCYYENGEIKVPKFNDDLIEQLRLDGYPPLSNFFIDKEGNYWIGTFKLNVYKIDKEGELTVFDAQSTFETNFGIQLFDIDPSHPKGFVYSSRLNKTTDSTALYHVFPSKNSTRQFSIPNVNLKYTNQGTRIARFNDSTFYLGIARSLRKLTSKGIVQSIELEAEILNSMAKDDDGNLWVGTREGIYLFEKGDLYSKPKIFLQEHQISSFFKDNEEGYWFTSLDRGVFYLPSLEIESVSSAEVHATRIKSLTKTKNGVYAASDNGNALFFKDGDINQSEILAKGYPSSLSYRFFNDDVSFYRDDGQLVYHDGSDLSVMEVSDITYKKNDFNSDYSYLSKNHRLYLKNMQLDTGFSFNAGRKKVRAVVVMANTQDVWFGTFDGLFLYRNKGLKYLGDDEGLLSSRISDLDIIDAHHILVSTRGNGVWILNVNNLEIQRLEEVDNAHSNSSLVDADGNVWISTFSGVYKIKDPLGKRRLVHYTIYDGLVSNEVLDLVSYDNRIWVATSKGISVFDKDWEPLHVQSTTLNIGKIKINNNETELASNYSLPYYQNNISLLVNVLSYRAPAKFEYKMSGLHEDWISTSDRELNFSNLKPGNYKLSLRRSSFSSIDPKDLEYKEDISFQIKAPFWSTQWFILSLFGAIVISLIIVINVRYGRVRKENRLFKLFIKSERKALRSQINPHFIFNALSVMLEISKKGETEKLNDYILNFSKLMRKTLEGSRMEEIDLKEEIKFLDMYLQLETQRTDGSFSYSIHVSEELKTKNYLIPPLLLQPYLENAIKHGVGSRTDGKAEVKLNFYIQENHLVAEVEDNGVGYYHGKSKTKKEHNSLSMKINKERLKLIDDEENIDIEINSLFQNEGLEYLGTQIRLTLPLKSAH